jgi:hypothetical protein
VPCRGTLILGGATRQWQLTRPDATSPVLSCRGQSLAARTVEMAKIQEDVVENPLMRTLSAGERGTSTDTPTFDVDRPSTAVAPAASAATFEDETMPTKLADESGAATFEDEADRSSWGQLQTGQALKEGDVDAFILVRHTASVRL